MIPRFVAAAVVVTVAAGMVAGCRRSTDIGLAPGDRDTDPDGLDPPGDDDPADDVIESDDRPAEADEPDPPPDDVDEAEPEPEPDDDAPPPLLTDAFGTALLRNGEGFGNVVQALAATPDGRQLFVARCVSASDMGCTATRIEVYDTAGRNLSPTASIDVLSPVTALAVNDSGSYVAWVGRAGAGLIDLAARVGSGRVSAEELGEEPIGAAIVPDSGAPPRLVLMTPLKLRHYDIIARTSAAVLDPPAPYTRFTRMTPRVRAERIVAAVAGADDEAVYVYRIIAADFAGPPLFTAVGARVTAVFVDGAGGTAWAGCTDRPRTGEPPPACAQPTLTYDRGTGAPPAQRGEVFAAQITTIADINGIIAAAGLDGRMGVFDRSGDRLVDVAEARFRFGTALAPTAERPFGVFVGYDSSAGLRFLRTDRPNGGPVCLGAEPGAPCGVPGGTRWAKCGPAPAGDAFDPPFAGSPQLDTCLSGGPSEMSPAVAGVVGLRRVTDLAATPDGERVAVYMPGTIVIGRPFAAAPPVVLDNLRGVYRLAITSDGRRVAISRIDGTIELRDAGTGGFERSFPVHQAGYGAVHLAFTPDGARIVSGGSTSGDTTVRVTDATSGRNLLTVNDASGFAVAPDGRRLVVARSTRLSVVNIADGAEIASVRDWTAGWDTGLAFAPAGDRFAAADGRGNVVIFSATDGALLSRRPIRADEAAFVPAVGEQPAGLLVSGGGRVRFIDDAGTLLGSWPGTRARVVTAVYPFLLAGCTTNNPFCTPGGVRGIIP